MPAQFDKVQRLIEAGIAEGATLVAGGPGPARGTRPRLLRTADRVRGCQAGHDDRARGDLRAGARRSCPIESEEEAVAIANDTPYGLSAYVQGGDLDRARRVARRIRAGNVHINYPPIDRGAPFGGYKQSGNGREWGAWGLHEFLEVKAIMGYEA